MGNPHSNPALLPAYFRRQISWVDASNAQHNASGFTGTGLWKGDDPHSVESFPNAWGTGTGFVFIGGNSRAALEAAASQFTKWVEEGWRDGKLTLPRRVAPGTDSLPGIAGYWHADFVRKLEAYVNQPVSHTSYSEASIFWALTLFTDLGTLRDEQVNDCENLAFRVLQAYAKTAFWWQSGPGKIGGRHQFMKNAHAYFVVEHLLTHGKPNPAAKRWLEEILEGKRQYFAYLMENVHRSDHEAEEGNQGWQHLIWYALATGDLPYLESEAAQNAALHLLMQSDNATRIAAHSHYEGVRDPSTSVTARLTFEAVAWGRRDGRWKWILEHLPWTRYQSPYMTAGPFSLPLDGITAKQPEEWLGVQALPLGPQHLKAAGSPPVNKTAMLVSLRDSWMPSGQFLCIDGYRLYDEPEGLGSVLRYSDRGKTFLLSFTGKASNYYQNGVVVSRGVAEFELPWAVELLHAQNFPRVGVASTRLRNRNGADWDRHVIWKRGQWLFFLDEVVASKPGDYSVTVCWRTHLPLITADNSSADESRGWLQQQGDVTFHIEPAQAVAQSGGQAAAADYPNEIVPYLLRQTLPLSGDAGARVAMGNLVYSSLVYSLENDSPARRRARRLSHAEYLVYVENDKGKAQEIALVGLGRRGELAAPIKTDADLFYLAPDGAAIVNGTFLELSGKKLIDQAEAGAHHIEVTGGDSGSVSEALNKALAQGGRLTSSAGPPPSEATPPELRAAWSFSDFAKQAEVIEPLGADMSSDGRTWQFRLPEHTKLGAVAIAFRTTHPPAGTSIAFSNDGFVKDVRATTTPMPAERHVAGPVSKGTYYDESVLRFPGQEATSVRVEAAVPPETREDLRIVLESAEASAPPLVRLEPAMLAGNQPTLLAQAGDHELMALDPAGRKLWSRRFPERVISWSAVTFGEDRSVAVMDAAGTMHLLGPDGEPRKAIKLTSIHQHWKSDYYARNRAYCMAPWRPQPGAAPWLVMGHFTGIGFLRPDGVAETFPNPNDSSLTDEQQGYLWRGLLYYEHCLPESEDFTGDGIDDQVFVSRGWATRPNIAFMDGARRTFYAEHRLSNAAPLTVARVQLPQEGPAVFVATEAMAGLFVAKTGASLWQVRCDSPAAAALPWPGSAAGELAFVMAKRDGIIVVLGADGKPRWQRVVPSRLTAACVAGQHLFVGSEEGVLCLDREAKPVTRWAARVSHLVTLDANTILAATHSPTRVAALQIPAASGK